MRRMLTLALLAALVTGCGSSAAPVPTVAAVPLEQPSPTPTPTPPTPTPTPTGPAAVGGTQESVADKSTVKAAVLRLRQPLRATVPGLPERAGYEYVGLEVRMCIVESTEPEPLGVSWRPWSLTFADDTVAEALSAWSAEWWSVSLYPQDRIVRPGSCVRGWIPFEAPKGSRPVSVAYQPGSGDALEWRVK